MACAIVMLFSVVVVVAIVDVYVSSPLLYLLVTIGRHYCSARSWIDEKRQIANSDTSKRHTDVDMNVNCIHNYTISKRHSLSLSHTYINEVAVES